MCKYKTVLAPSLLFIVSARRRRRNSKTSPEVGRQYSLTGRVKEELTRFPDCGIKSIRPILKTEMLIYLSKANFHVKILFRSSSHLLDSEI